MLKIKARAFTRAVATLERISILIGHIEKPFPLPENNGENIGPRMRELSVQHMTALSSHADAMNTRVTGIAINELIGRLKDDKEEMDWKSLGDWHDDIAKTLFRELELVHLFCVMEDDAKLIEPKSPLFGQRVHDAFPSAAWEIEEGGKCRGLQRPTACVFHLMRVMEIGLKATAKCLGIPDPTKDKERNWGFMLDRINDAIAAKSQSNSAGWLHNKADKAFFKEIHGTLDAVRSAWRNSTMHVENKYTGEEAEHIWVAVKGFMQKLASRCDEEGQPPA